MEGEWRRAGGEVAMVVVGVVLGLLSFVCTFIVVLGVDHLDPDEDRLCTGTIAASRRLGRAYGP